MAAVDIEMTGTSHRHLAALFDRALFQDSYYWRDRLSVTPEMLEALAVTMAGRMAQLADAWDDLIAEIKAAIRAELKAIIGRWPI